MIKFDVSKTSYYVEVENGALLRDDTRSWKMIIGGHEKSRNILGKECMNHVIVLCIKHRLVKQRKQH